MGLSASHLLREDQTLFFCVGAQKSGTTWLYDYLLGHPEVALTHLKELTYFTELYAPRGSGWSPLVAAIPMRLKRAQARYQLEKRMRGVGRRNRWASLTEAMTSPQGYPEVMCQEVTAETRATGDITPLYATLGSDAFSEMAGMHSRTSVLFLMRDPVARMWSQIRMDAGRRARRKQQDFAEAVAEIAEASFTDPRYQRRADYRGTIEALDRAFPDSDQHFFFYEALFEPGTIAAVCAALNISYVPAEAQKRVHGSRKASMPGDWATRMREALEPQYRFIEQRFGDRVPANWDLAPATATQERAADA